MSIYRFKSIFIKEKFDYIYLTKGLFNTNELANKLLVASFSAGLLSMAVLFQSRAGTGVFVYFSNIETSLWHDKMFCQHLSIFYTNKKEFALCNRIKFSFDSPIK